MYMDLCLDIIQKYSGVTTIYTYSLVIDIRSLGSSDSTESVM